MTDAEGEGRFLARWSRRKRTARLGVAERERPCPEFPDPAMPDAATPDRETPEAPGDGSVPFADRAADGSAAAGPPSERELTDADMPPLETLGAFSDYSGFLSRGVSTALRRQALTKLFHSPHLNVTDGLDDFAEDYTRFESLGDLITVDMRHQMEVAVRRLAERAEREGARVLRHGLEKAPLDSLAVSVETEPAATLAGDDAPDADVGTADGPAPPIPGGLT